MNRFREMQVFLAVAEAGSFAVAAQRLEISPASVTRAVTQLEQRLGTRLLLRSTRRVCLTEEGKVFRADCLRIFKQIEDADAAVKDV